MHINIRKICGQRCTFTFNVHYLMPEFLYVHILRKFNEKVHIAFAGLPLPRAAAVKIVMSDIWLNLGAFQLRKGVIHRRPGPLSDDRT